MPGQPVNLKGLAGASLLLWGWFSGYLPVAVLLAILVETAPWISWRLNLAERDFNRIVDITSLLVTALSIFFISTSGPESIFKILLWLPAAFSPIIFAQCYSTAGKLTWANLFWSLRRARPHNVQLASKTIDLMPVYITINVIAATAAASSSPWLPAGLAVIAAWSLFLLRSRRSSIYVWAIVILSAFASAYLVQAGLKSLYGFVTASVVDWMTGSDWESDSLSASHTAIGRLGRLKLSEEILFRIKGNRKPPLLRQASFQDYRNGSWLAPDSKKQSLVNNEGEQNWIFGDQNIRLKGDDTSMQSLLFSGQIKAGNAALPLPAGIIGLTGLPADNVTVNGLGAVMLEGDPGWAEFAIKYQPGTSVRDQPPDKFDLVVPKTLKPLLSDIVDTRMIRNKPAITVLNSVDTFFRDGFRYSLVQQTDGTGTGQTPLEYFLTASHKGHCEFYASATVLLLREAGVPARYATGFAPVEYRGLDDSWPIRLRHAHAWAMAWVNGRWVDLDTTPSIWAEHEAGNASLLQPLADLLALLVDQVHGWRNQLSGQASLSIYWVIVAFSLLALVSFRRLAGKLQKNTEDNNGKPDRVDEVVLQTSFNRVIEALGQQYPGRGEGETLVSWITRVCPGELERLRPMIAWHYQQRFGSSNMPKKDFERLHNEVDKWLSQTEAR